MEFVKLDPETFRKFAAKSPYKSFMQTPEIASYREQNGWVPYYFGVKKDSILVAATMMVAKPTFLGKSTFYAPGGPLLDFTDTALTRFFFKKLLAYVKTHNGYVFHMDPYYELIERDRRGKEVSNGFNHSSVVDTLTKIGFRPITDSTQPRYTFVMDLRHRTTDQVFADMKNNTRNYIRKAERAGVRIRELKRSELDVFKQITESTSNRRHFADMPLSYYQQMYDLFHARREIKFILAEAEIDHQITPLSVAMFMLYGDEVIYLFSGSDEKYMRNYCAQYLVQWYMIQYAVKHKYQTYNFYGIKGLPDPSHPDYGIYGFKKGFDAEHSRVVELIGSYEIPVNTSFYTAHALLSKLKHLKK